MMRLLLIAFAAVGLAGCFSPSYTNGNVKCASSGKQCPDGYYCAPDNTCWNMPFTGGGDMAMPPPPAQVVPRAVWTSSGGGAATAASGAQANLSVGGVSAVGHGTASSGNQINTGFFCTDSF